MIPFVLPWSSDFQRELGKFQHIWSLSLPSLADLLFEKLLITIRVITSHIVIEPTANAAHFSAFHHSCARLASDVN